MTTEKAIEVFEGICELEGISMFYQPGGKAAKLEISSIKKACQIAISALHTEQAMPPNAPLTLEELREMDGEPVWIQPAARGGKIPARWMLLECFSEDADLYLFRPVSGISQGYTGIGCGRTWLAYRSRPEEGMA